MMAVLMRPDIVPGLTRGLELPLVFYQMRTRSVGAR
jgi:hypothetical protein